MITPQLPQLQISSKVLDAEGPGAEGPDSEGPASEMLHAAGPDSEGLQFLTCQNLKNPKWPSPDGYHDLGLPSKCLDRHKVDMLISSMLLCKHASNQAATQLTAILAGCELNALGRYSSFRQPCLESLFDPGGRVSFLPGAGLEGMAQQA